MTTERTAPRTAPRKTDAERGPLGAWAYGTRTLLQASSVDAAAAAGVKEPTLRKIEGGSNKQPARRLVFDLWQYYARLGREQHIPVEDPPEAWRTPTAGMAEAAPDLAVAITALTQELEAWRSERLALRSELAALKALVGTLVGESQPELAPEVPAAPAALPRSAGSGR